MARDYAPSKTSDRAAVLAQIDLPNRGRRTSPRRSRPNFVIPSSGLAVKASGIKKGGKFVNGIHFIAAGGAIGSMLALMSYFGTGEIKDRYFGVKIPKANLQPSYLGSRGRSRTNWRIVWAAPVKSKAARLD